MKTTIKEIFLEEGYASPTIKGITLGKKRILGICKKI